MCHCYDSSASSSVVCMYCGIMHDCAVRQRILFAYVNKEHLKTKQKPVMTVIPLCMLKNYYCCVDNKAWSSAMDQHQWHAEASRSRWSLDHPLNLSSVHSRTRQPMQSGTSRCLLIFEWLPMVPSQCCKIIRERLSWPFKARRSSVRRWTRHFLMRVFIAFFSSDGRVKPWITTVLDRHCVFDGISNLFQWKSVKRLYFQDFMIPSIFRYCR